MNLFKRIISNAQKQAQTKKNAIIRNDAEQLLQIREFGGKIYISYRDIPLFETTGIDQLEKVRETYMEYIRLTTKDK